MGRHCCCSDATAVAVNEGGHLWMVELALSAYSAGLFSVGSSGLFEYQHGQLGPLSITMPMPAAVALSFAQPTATVRAD